MYVTRCATLALLRPPMACLCVWMATSAHLAPSWCMWTKRPGSQLRRLATMLAAAASLATGCVPLKRQRVSMGWAATGGTARRHSPSGQIWFLVQTLRTCGIRPCLSATIPVFQFFDAPRPDDTHPPTRSFASPKGLIDEGDVLSPPWGVFPLTAALDLPQELHTLVWQRPCLDCCMNHAELSGVLFCSGPSLASMAAQLLPTTVCFPCPRDALEARRSRPARPTTAFSKGRHPSNRWLCKSPSLSVVLGCC